MTPEKQRIAIAEACGWKNCRIDRCGATGICPPLGDRINGQLMPLPNYLNDLNAINNAILLKLSLIQYTQFKKHLKQIITKNNSIRSTRLKIYNATAAQRCEAFLRTIGKWEETEAK